MCGRLIERPPKTALCINHTEIHFYGHSYSYKCDETHTHHCRVTNNKKP